MFVSLARTLREAPLEDEVRELAFESVERMGRSWSRNSFAEHLRSLKALAASHAALACALEPFWGALQAIQDEIPG